MTTLKEFGYEDKKVIGRGQYGKAHLVECVQDQGLFIAKTIDLTCLSGKERETALQEVALLRRLDHPNIVEYKDNFFMADTLVIIMQYCEGGDLQAYIKEKFKEKQRIREVQIMHYFVQVMQALQYIHSKRILHRDLKTSNLFLMNTRKVVKLGDFGISRVLEGSIEAAMTVVGTPYYMSPEVCENKPYTFKSDVWSLGCVLYELCMLKHAFAADNLLGLVYKIVSDKYEPIPKMYSSSLNGLIQSMLEKDAEKRPSVRDLLADDYVHQFMKDYVGTGGQVVTSKQAGPGGASGRATASRAGGAGAIAGAPAAAHGAEARPPGTAGGGGGGGGGGARPPRPGPQRQERGDQGRRAGGGAAGGGGGAGVTGGAARKKDETPQEALRRRKREAADRQAAELKAAAKKAEENRMVAKHMQEREFQSTRLGRGMAVVRENPTTPGGSPGEVPPEEDDEEDEYSEDTQDEDYEEYEDDFVSEGEESDDAEDAESGAEEQAIGPMNSEYRAACAVREGEDSGRIMANYKQILSNPHEGNDTNASPPPRRASPSPTPSPAEIPVGGGGAIMSMESRAGKLRDELVQKMGAETFQKTFGYLLKAREERMDDTKVKRELEALVGRETYKKYCFDVDQLVFQQMCYGSLRP